MLTWTVCPACRAELASFRDVTGRMAAALPVHTPSAVLEGRIMQGIAAAGRGAPGRVARTAAAVFSPRPLARSHRGRAVLCA